LSAFLYHQGNESTFFFKAENTDNAIDFGNGLFTMDMLPEESSSFWESVTRSVNDTFFLGGLKMCNTCGCRSGKKTAKSTKGKTATKSKAKPKKK
jgi:hypothetical protein